MTDYPLDGLGGQIKAHWKTYRPQVYAELETSGDLAESLHAAQERTSDLMESLLDKGLPYHQAWELAREEWAFLPSEEDADEAEDASLSFRARCNSRLRPSWCGLHGNKAT